MSSAHSILPVVVISISTASRELIIVPSLILSFSIVLLKSFAFTIELSGISISSILPQASLLSADFCRTSPATPYEPLKDIALLDLGNSILSALNVVRPLKVLD